jgi:hypothetical protein
MLNVVGFTSPSDQDAQACISYAKSEAANSAVFTISKDE